MTVVKVKAHGRNHFCHVPDRLYDAALREKQFSYPLASWAEDFRRGALVALEKLHNEIARQVPWFDSSSVQRCHTMENGFISYKFFSYLKRNRTHE